MADTQTPVYELIKPEVGASQDSWGGKLNGNMDKIETALVAKLDKAGGTMTGQLVLPAATASLSPVRVPHGTAHATPTNGDVWSTTAGFFVRVNGGTYQLATLTGTETLANKTLTSPALTTPTLGAAAATSIHFGNETLDSFRETSWTPTLLFGGSNTGMTLSRQVGRYVKVGRLVLAQFRLELSAVGSATGIATVSGLPHSAENGNGAAGSLGVNHATSLALLGTISGLALSLSNTTLYLQNGGGTLTHANFQAGVDIFGAIAYDSGV
jgi:hypothetical protein